MTTVLCKYRGMLVFMSVSPAKDGIGHCPDCGGTSFRDAPWGWVECTECGFAVAEESIQRASVNVHCDRDAYKVDDDYLWDL